MKSNSENLNITIHDIKPLIEIEEYSFVSLVIVTIFILLLLIGLSYLLYNYYKKRDRVNVRAEHLKLLRSIDLDDAKDAAYRITKYGITFRDDSLRHKQNYEVLVELLESYKYRKNVESFDDETKRQFERYLGMIDV